MCYWVKNPYTSLKWYIHSPPIYLCRKQWCREYRWCRGRWRHRFRPNEDQASWCELPFRRRYCSVPRQQRDRSFLRDLQREVPTQKQWSPINELKRSISDLLMNWRDWFRKYLINMFLLTCNCPTSCIADMVALKSYSSASFITGIISNEDPIVLLPFAGEESPSVDADVLLFMMARCFCRHHSPIELELDGVAPVIWITIHWSSSVSSLI